MNIYTNNSTPKHGLSATKQAPKESGNSQNIFQTNQLCPHCGSGDFSTGAGLKPGQISLRRSDCKAFVGYQNLEKLQRLRRRKSLTLCLELLQGQGLSGDTAIFVLSQVGGAE